MDELKDAVRGAVKEAVDEALKPFYIERETHYQHHEFLGKFIDLSNTVLNSGCAAAAKIVIGAMFALLLFGFIMWGKHNFK